MSTFWNTQSMMKRSYDRNKKTARKGLFSIFTAVKWLQLEVLRIVFKKLLHLGNFTPEDVELTTGGTTLMQFSADPEVESSNCDFRILMRVEESRGDGRRSRRFSADPEVEWSNCDFRILIHVEESRGDGRRSRRVIEEQTESLENNLKEIYTEGKKLNDVASTFRTIAWDVDLFHRQATRWNFFGNTVGALGGAVFCMHFLPVTVIVEHPEILIKNLEEVYTEGKKRRDHISTLRTSKLSEESKRSSEKINQHAEDASRLAEEIRDLKGADIHQNAQKQRRSFTG